MRPLIGVTCDYSNEDPKHFWLREEYASAVWAAGGWPVLLPPIEGIEIDDIVSKISGLVLTGGDFDIEPSYYKEEPHPKLGKINPNRSRFELSLAGWALENDFPVLGICGGMQTINVAAGGNLYQDISSQLPNALFHEKKRYADAHEIEIEKNGILSRAMGIQKIFVNSSHHQAVKDAAPGFFISAKSPVDGIIEAIESKSHRFILGIQWHPEALYSSNPEWLKIFTAFMSAL